MTHILIVCMCMCVFRDFIKLIHPHLPCSLALVPRILFSYIIIPPSLLYIELQVLEITSQLKESKLTSQQELTNSITKLTSDFDATISSNTKMIAALKLALHKTRSEKSYLEEKSNVERTEAVNTVRTKMNEEIANIKNVLKNVKGEMENKELIMKEVMEDKVESESLMEEIRYVFVICISLYIFCLVMWCER